MIATLAVSWCTLLGIGSLIAYSGHRELEGYFRAGAGTWDAKGEAARAAEWRRLADGQARLEQECLPRGITALALVGLGGVLGGVGLAVRSRYIPATPARSRSVDAVAAVCSVGTKVLVAGLILGAIAYVGILLLVLAGDD